MEANLHLEDTHEFDFLTQEAVILIPENIVPLPEYLGLKEFLRCNNSPVNEYGASPDAFSCEKGVSKYGLLYHRSP